MKFQLQSLSRVRQTLMRLCAIAFGVCLVIALVRSFAQHSLPVPPSREINPQMRKPLQQQYSFLQNMVASGWQHKSLLLAQVSRVQKLPPGSQDAAPVKVTLKNSGIQKIPPRSPQPITNSEGVFTIDSQPQTGLHRLII